MCRESGNSESWLWSTWVKTPNMKNSDLLIVSACLPVVNPKLYREISKNKRVLLACPERENPTYYGKIASIIRSVNPKRVTVVTIDGSPHCFALQASVNEAEYILGERVERKHYVLVNSEELVEVKPETIRVARYLSLVGDLISRNPEVLDSLTKMSLEHSKSRGYKKSV